MKCEICGKDCNGVQALSQHIGKVHNISTFELKKDYFDKYFKTNNDGICLCCGKPTKFINIAQGYEKYCSVYCEPNIDKSNIVICDICGEEFKKLRFYIPIGTLNAINEIPADVAIGSEVNTYSDKYTDWYGKGFTKGKLNINAFYQKWQKK